VSSSTLEDWHCLFPLHVLSTRWPSQAEALSQTGSSLKATQSFVAAQQFPEGQQKPFWQWFATHSYTFPQTAPFGFFGEQMFLFRSQ